jgi:two-component system, sensor histidine kinase RegB
MTQVAPYSSQPDKYAPGVLRLRTLVMLRWLAIVGQSAAIFCVHFVLTYPVPLLQTVSLILLSAILNLCLTFRWRAGQLLRPLPAGLLLAYDIAQLAGLLYLTGGLQNPFSFLFLVPVTVSATSLPLAWTLGLGAFAFALGTLLAFQHMPLPWDPSAQLILPPTYVAGMWTALAAATFFASVYARRIAVEARQMSTALNAAELVLARAQRLSALDGLAAAAAHELGTPLATIALVAKELKREMPASTPHAEDIELLISQTARCREILSKLANRDQVADEIFEKVKLTAMIEDLVAPLRGSDVTIRIDAAPHDGGKATLEPVFRRNPAITYGLGNLLENAIDFAATDVAVLARWNAMTVSITVTDDGPGFDQAIFDRLGDPFVTTRPGYDKVHESEAETEGRIGMGLGLFIAKTLLERSGAAVVLANRTAPARGATVSLTWARQVVDMGLEAVAPAEAV